MVRDILKILNTELKGLTSDESIYGLTQSILRIQGLEREILPCVVSEDGEGKYVGLDDVKSVIIYHKLNSSSTRYLTNGKGDNPGDIVNTYAMSLLIYWDRKRLNKYPDEMLQVIQARIPVLILDMPNTKSVRTQIGNSNFNSLQVYGQEYQETNPKLPANINLMQVNYTIEITFNPACIESCP